MGKMPVNAITDNIQEKTQYEQGEFIVSQNMAYFLPAVKLGQILVLQKQGQTLSHGFGGFF